MRELKRDAESKKRPADLEGEIEKVEREFSGLNEVWKSEQAALQGDASIKARIGNETTNWKPR